jgi:hypothetical protein
MLAGCPASGWLFGETQHVQPTAAGTSSPGGDSETSWRRRVSSLFSNIYFHLVTV